MTTIIQFSLLVTLFQWLILGFVLEIYQFVSSCTGCHDSSKPGNEPIVLWWTPFTGETGNVRQCGQCKCFFTENRNFVNNSRTRAIMFYGSNFDPVDLPLPRTTQQLWALLHEESPKNNPILCNEDALNLFNFTSTWSRKSDFPLTLLSLKHLKDISDTTFYVLPSAKETWKRTYNKSSVVYVQSSCDAPSQRDSFVLELMKWIPVDSYGKCLNNMELPSHLQEPAESMESEEFFKVMANYKFTLAFENAIGEDYITEKLWRTLKLGSVPVYYGSPSVQDWLPNNKSAIIINPSESAQLIAETLHYLDSNEEAYLEFLQHKSGKTENLHLVSAMEERQWGDDYDQENFVEAFECFICKQVHERMKLEAQGFSPKPSFANIHHYKCSFPIDPVTGIENKENWWTDYWRKTAIEALILKQFVTRNKPFSPEDFYEAVIKHLEDITKNTIILMP